MRKFVLVLAGIFMGSAAMAQGFSEDFGSLKNDLWHVAEYDFDHPMFDTDWRTDHATVEDGLTLRVAPQTGKANGFTGGSIRRTLPTHYGRYSAIIHPAAGEGLVTGFFTYTGPAYGTRHDEIDIEFLGKDTTRLHAAWFVDGVLNSRFIDLGYDAAAAPRLYAFDWLPDRIRWYADGELILEITEADGPLPHVPGMLFANLWAADHSVAIWSGKTRPDISATARMNCASFAPWTGSGFDAPRQSCDGASGTERLASANR